MWGKGRLIRHKNSPLAREGKSKREKSFIADDADAADDADKILLYVKEKISFLSASSCAALRANIRVIRD